jgi:dTDP-4-dehydrorhamnose reductase
MSKPLVWITGAGGLIGSHLVKSAKQLTRGWKFLPLTREKLDLSDFAAVDGLFAAQPPALIIHCAALSRMAACQADPALAERMNVSVAGHLCELAGKIPLIFFSTDLVFDGRKGDYVETDPVNPLSVYAKTKVRAEELVLRNSRHTVVRLALNTGRSPAGTRSFTEEMRAAFARGKALKLFTDEFRCPIPVQVTARAIWDLAQSGRPGLYHLAGREKLSRWEIGQMVASRWPDVQARIEPSSLKDYHGPSRPADTSLNCAKIADHLSFRLPGLSEWLRDNPDEPV